VSEDAGNSFNLVLSE
jgi:hypothetical protein